MLGADISEEDKSFELVEMPSEDSPTDLSEPEAPQKTDLFIGFDS